MRKERDWGREALRRRLQHPSGCSTCKRENVEFGTKKNGKKYAVCVSCTEARNNWLRNPENKEKVLRNVRNYNRKNWKKILLHAAKIRAEKRGVPFDLEEKDLPEIPKTCPLLEVEMMPSVFGEGQKSASTSPSLDCILPKLGYVKNNVWWISRRANTIKNNALPDELKKIAEGVTSEAKNRGLI